MWTEIAEFVFKLLSGEIWAIWQKHKTTEAINAQNKVAAMSDSAVADKLRRDFTIYK